MATDTRISRPPERKPPLWRNVTVLKWAAQLVVLAGLIALVVILGLQAAGNLQAQGRSFGWGFLSRPAGIQIGEGIFTRPANGFQVIQTGAVNMLRITVSGILAASVLGVIVGVSRLSANWLLNRLATVYIEILRNIPLLVQIVFWFFVASLTFPNVSADQEGTQWLVISNKGVSIPWFFPTETFWQWSVFVIAGLIAARLVYRARIRRLEETGADTYPGRYAFLTFSGVVVAGWFLHPVAGAVGWVWQLLASIVSAVPTLAWQLALAAAAVYLAVRWIRRFLDSLRSPAGLAKLTDDDWFRIGLAGAVGVVAAAALVFIPTLTASVVDLVDFVLRFLDQKFDFLRTGSPLRFARPDVVVPGRFPQIGTSGMTMTPAFFGVWIGVTLYTAAFIAEVVRGGVLAVPKGQTEAGLALGLRRSQLLRMIILPQAFRIILPPIGNQYLNLAKNTSLGIAVAYPEIVAVGQTLANQTGQAMQTFLIWIVFYLIVSLVLSGIVNRYNRRLALVER
ncbi:MAG TPA: ABC transporter permease subunit [Acidimicrobiia bacterium]|nr:ABC transporter permease subunit [Acidimicrobiia bacterium]